MRLLLAEDHSPLRDSLSEGLRNEGYAVDATGDGEEAWWYLRDSDYDAVILDRMLPGCDGLVIVRRLREQGSSTPVLLLTAMDGVEDRVAGLDAGADDYLVKPFAVPELLARLRNLTRRQFGIRNPILRHGQLAIDPAAKTVTWGQQMVTVTAREFDLLLLLTREAGRVLSRQELWEHCYDFESETSSNVLDVLIARVRKKLQQAGAPNIIQTRRGLGYQLHTEPSS